jgi:LysM repeat protein
MPLRRTTTHATTLLSLVTGPVSARRWWVRVLLRLTGGGLGVLLLVAAVIAYLLTISIDVPRAQRLARAELQVLLEPTERVESAAWARRREWWDGFRETYGMLALTDRRVVFVGIPPRELLSPERGPQQFVILQIARDATLRAKRERVDLGSAAGVALESDRVRMRFASDDSRGLSSLLGNVAQGRSTDAATVDLGRRAREYEAQVTAQAVWHVVAPGDALASVAARYGTTEAQLTALNRLPSTTIRIGQRLLVKSGR